MAATNYIFELNTQGRGARGLSAYQVAVNDGFEGTEADWLESLRGADGEDGQDGSDASVTPANVLLAEQAMSAAQKIASRAATDSADNNAILRESFARWNNGTAFAHNTRAPELGGSGNWRMHSTGGGTAASIVDDAVYGRGLVPGAPNLYYLANDVGAGVPIRRVVIDLTLKATGNNTGTKAGFTLLMQPTPIITPDGTGLNIQTGMFHFTFRSSDLGLGISNAPAATFDPVIADGETTSPIWHKDALSSGLTNNTRYIAIWELEGETVTFTMAGRSWRLRDARIPVAAFNSVGFETDGANGKDNIWIVHNVAVNGPMPAWALQHNSLAKSAILEWSPGQSQVVYGGALTFAYGTPSADWGHRSPRSYLTERQFVMRLGSSSGEAACIANGAINVFERSSTTTQVLSDNWHDFGSPPLRQDGEYVETNIHLYFPTSNNKQVSIYVGGSSQFTTGTINHTGYARILITRHRLTSSKTGQLHFTYLCNGQSPITGFVDRNGDETLQLRCVAATANGDVVFKCVTGKVSYLPQS